MNNKEQIKEFKEIIVKNDIKEINNYYIDNNIIFNNYEDFEDVIIYGIDKNVSSKIIKIILNQKNIENDWLSNLLFYSVKNNYFEVADILLKNKAKWKCFEINENQFGLEDTSLNFKNLKYLLDKNFYSTEKTTCLKHLFYRFIEANNSKYNKFLEIIFSHFKFSNEFIIKIITEIKSKSSNEQIQKLIMDEKEKIIIDNTMYEKAIEKKNYEALRILFEYESSEEDKIQRKIIYYDLLKYSIFSKNYNFVKKVLSYRPFSYKYPEYKSLLKKAFESSMTEETINNKKNISKLLIKSFITNLKKFTNIDNNKTYNIQFLNLIINLAIKEHNFILFKYLIESEDFKMTTEEINSEDIKNEYLIITSLTSRNIEAFKFLLSHGADPNTKNNGGRSLLSLAIDKAIDNDDFSFFKFLLNQPNVKINEKDSQGIYPITKAVNKNRSEMVELLINYASNHKVNLDITVKDLNGNSPLMIAIENNNIEIIKLLINYTYNNNNNNTIDLKVNEENINGITPLLQAINKEYYDIVKLLIDYVGKTTKVNILYNEKDPKGKSLLFEAINNDNFELVKILINYGKEFEINMNNIIVNGYTPLIYSYRNDHLKIFEYLLEYFETTKVNILYNEKDPEGKSLLFEAINKDNFELVMILIDYGIKYEINMNNIIVNGYTPLTYSYRNNHLKIFEYLLEYFDVNQKDSQGNTVLYYAIDDGNIDMINKLISIKTEIDIKSLNKAIHKNNNEILKKLLENDIILSKDNYLIINIITSKNTSKEYFIKLLIEKGCNVNQIEYGLSALIYAIECDCPEIVKLLLQNGADVNYKCRDGCTPLTYAIKHYNKEIIYSLIEYGCNIKNVICHYDCMEKIIRNNDLDLLKKLVKNNFDLNSKCKSYNYNYSLLQIAIMFKKTDIVKFLIKCGVSKDIERERNIITIHEFNRRNNSGEIYDEIEKLLNKL